MPTDDEWFDLLCKSYTAPPVYYNGALLPAFPSDELQTNTTGQSGMGTLCEAFPFYKTCMETFVSLGRPLDGQHNLLDFGVGWGRIARFFLRELPPQNVFGIDVTPEFIDVCKKSFKSNNFIVTTPLPPTPIPDERFDFIVGYSVFSHLSESASAAWMNEFHRILRPGGVVALTTRDRTFLDACEALKDTNATGYGKSLSMLFEDFDAARRKYDQGKFLHSNIEGVNGGGYMNSTFYGETFIPEKYAREAYREQFTLEHFVFDPGKHRQAIMFFCKK